MRVYSVAAAAGAAAILILGACIARAGTFEGTVEITDASGTIVFQQVTSFVPAAAVLPKSFESSGTLEPGSYTLCFELGTSGTASDDPNDDRTINLRDLEYQTLTGEFSLDLAGSFEATSAYHVVDIETNNIREPGVPDPDVNESVESSLLDLSARLFDFASSDSNSQFGLGDAELDSTPTATGFTGFGMVRMQTSNYSGLPAGASAGNNSASARTRSVWSFTLTESVDFTVASDFDGSGDPGFTQLTAFLPSGYAAATETAAFFVAPSDSWFEAAPAPALAFQAEDGALFTALLAFPAQTDSDDQFQVEADGLPLGSFSVGEAVDFGPGVGHFVIRGIEIAVDAVDPLAFPVQLAFDPPTIAFEVTPVPEPGARMLATAGLLGIAWLRRLCARSP